MVRARSTSMRGRSGSERSSWPGLAGCGPSVSGDAGRGLAPTQPVVTTTNSSVLRIRVSRTEVSHALPSDPLGADCRLTWALSTHGVGPVRCVEGICGFRIFPIRMRCPQTIKSSPLHCCVHKPVSPFTPRIVLGLRCTYSQFFFFF